MTSPRHHNSKSAKAVDRVLGTEGSEPRDAAIRVWPRLATGTEPNPPTPQRLNIGCGRRFHRDWVNVDLVPSSPHVQRCDIVQGLPFADGTFAAVYHSHVLEHLSLSQGQRLLEDCFRVLTPGGCLRIVVPDLEQIARLYLEMHELAWHGDRSSMANYEWMKLELLDQLVRSQSGGMMGQFMAQLDQNQAAFVRSRAGVEFDLCRGMVDATPAPAELIPAAKPAKAAKQPGTNRGHSNPYVVPSWRQRLCRWVIKRLLGHRAVHAFDESMFRNAGEIHRWMYDRFSLRSLCERVGFVNFRVCSAFESSIDHFSSFQLDTQGTTVYKPDSLFVECEKPKASSQAMSAAA